MSAAAKTAPKSGELTPKKNGHLKPAWKKGQSGNPRGRPKGARSRLASQFVHALHADFTQHGADVISRVREEDPTAYLNVMSRMVPREVLVAMFAPKAGEDVPTAVVSLLGVHDGEGE